VKELLCMLQRAGKWEVRHYSLLYSRTARLRRGRLRYSFLITFLQIYFHQPCSYILLLEHFHFHSLTDSSQGKRVMMAGFGRLHQTDEPAAFHLLQLID
jgi:hypothetical protein